MELYELHLEKCTFSPLEWKGKVQIYIPMLFITTPEYWYYIIGVEPRRYFDRSRKNCYLGPMAYRFSTEGIYKDADKMTKDSALHIIIMNTCLYYGIAEEGLVIHLDKDT